jgi:hypothetical protein
MKHRWPIYLAVIVAGAALAVAWVVQPEDYDLPPEIARELTNKNVFPGSAFIGSRIPGVVWETYNVPLPYSQVIKAMKSMPDWEGREEELFPGAPRTRFRSTEAGPQAGVDVMPGQLFASDPSGPDIEPPSENFTVVMVATPAGQPLRKTFLAWVDRLRGHKPPVSVSPGSIAYTFPHEFRPGAKSPMPTRGVVIRVGTPKPKGARP